MPELPEVETTKRAIAVFEGQVLKKIEVHNPNLRWSVDCKTIKTIKETEILSITRRAKYILIQFKNYSLIIHLGMTGTMRILPIDSNVTRKHDHVVFYFAEHKLIFNDARRFGSLHITKSPGNHFLLSALGPEPNQSDFNADFLYQKIKTSNTHTKSFLMNQKNVVGIGNIYACEILFAAGISPRRKIKYLTKKDCRAVVDQTHRIINLAIEKGGTTLQDFYAPDGNKGYFKIELNVYGREHQECRNCHNPIKRIVQNQRSTFFCNKCQN